MEYYFYFPKLTILLERVGKLATIFDKVEQLFDNKNKELVDAIADFWAIVIQILSKAFVYLKKTSGGNPRKPVRFAALVAN